jgi:hypothetical protein
MPAKRGYTSRLKTTNRPYLRFVRFGRSGPETPGSAAPRVLFATEALAANFGRMLVHWV